MNIKRYQEFTQTTAVYPPEAGLIYCVLGLLSEAGEIAQVVKKSIRDNKGVLLEVDREKLFFEIGDVAWYLSQLCNELDFNFATLLEKNMVKLKSRQSRNVLGGSGDDR